MVDLDSRIRSSLDQLEVAGVESEEIAARGARRRRRRRGLAGGLMVAGITIAIVAALVTSPSNGPLGPVDVQASAELALPGRVLDTASEGRHLWVLTCARNCNDAGYLVKVDGRSARIVSTTRVRSPQAIAANSRGVWSVDFATSSLTRLDPETGDVTATTKLRIPPSIPIPEGHDDRRFLPSDLVVDDHSVWVSTALGYVARIDQDTDEVEDVIELEPALTGPIVAGPGAAWVVNGPGQIVRIDSHTSETDEVPITASDGDVFSVATLTIIDGDLWATGNWSRPVEVTGGPTQHIPTGQESVVQVDARTGKVVRVVPAPQPLLAVAGSNDEGLWLGRFGGGRTIYKLAPDSQTVIPVVHLEHPGMIVGVIEDSLWIARPHRSLEKYPIPVGVD